MHVHAHQIVIAHVDARRGDRTGNHLAGLAEEILVVRAASGTVGENQSWLPAAPSSPAALRIVGRSGGDIAQVNEVQLGDVHAQLHSRGTEEQRQIPTAETFFTVLTVLRVHLGGVLACLEHTLQIDEALVALEEVTVDFRRDFAGLQQARAINRANLTIGR
jgi:hypothetical protein